MPSNLSIVCLQCSLQCAIYQWSHVMFSSTVAQEFGACDDGLRQALAQIPVFPGKALLPNTKCSSGTVCTFLSVYVSPVYCTKTNLSDFQLYKWEPSKRFLFFRGSKWHALYADSVISFRVTFSVIAPLIMAIFGHCLLPFSSNVCSS